MTERGGQLPLLLDTEKASTDGISIQYFSTQISIFFEIGCKTFTSNNALTKMSFHRLLHLLEFLVN